MADEAGGTGSWALRAAGTTQKEHKLGEFSGWEFPAREFSAREFPAREFPGSGVPRL